MAVISSQNGPVTIQRTGSLLEGRVLSGFDALDRADWDRAFGDRAEGYDYFRACETAPLPMFRHKAVAVHAGDHLIAGAPAFEATFNLDMAFGPALRAIAAPALRLAPRLFKVRVLGAGSPHSNELALAMGPERHGSACIARLDALLKALEAHGRKERIKILFIKDVTDRQAAWADDTLRAHGYARFATLPLAHLELPFEKEEQYVASLSANMRSNLRRKLKAAEAVEVEITSDIRGAEAEIMSLRRETQAQAKANYGDFEELSDGYFAAVLANMPDRAKLILYRLAGRLIGFSLVLIDGHKLAYKYTGMRYPEAREKNLYFLNWMTMVRLCLAHGIGHLHAGDTTYLTKVRLGCKLERSWIYYRHLNPLINIGFRMASPFLAIDTKDPDLAALGEQAPYLRFDGPVATASPSVDD